MKKIILISAGVITILLIVAVWAYLMLNGRPESAEEVFSQFGSLSTNEPTQQNTTPNNNESEGIDEEVSNIDTTPMKLKQLTTRPVAGAVLKDNIITYVEQGTGHVYEINLTEGLETLVSGTTLTQTVEAVFSDDATLVAITTFFEEGTETIVGNVLNGELVGKKLPKNANNITFNGGDLMYTLKHSGGSRGYLYDFQDGGSDVVFETPLQDIVVLWGTPIYLYTTPSNQTTGYVYELNDDNHKFITTGTVGLVAVRGGDSVIASADNLRGRGYTLAGDVVEQVQSYIPEKCIYDSVREEKFYCGVPKTFDARTFPDTWYKGLNSYNDRLWLLDPKDGSATTLLDFQKESGREIDIHKIGISDDGLKLWFVNKNDNTLWLYDRTVR